MVDEISASDRSNNSANLTITKEYLVIKGKHFQVRNGYLYRSKEAQAISLKDILSMEYLTMRSKRLFILFMVLMTLVVFGGVGIRKLLSVTGQIDKEVQKVENVYNYIAEEDININITSAVENVLSQVGIKGIITIYIVLIIGSVGCLLFYLLRPFRMLYISAIGKIVAVERKFYDKKQLECVVKEWQKQLK